MKLGAVVVTYESADALPGLLSTMEVNEPDVDILVVDNGSPSGPPSVNERVRLVVLEGNRGYGGASNVGGHHLVDQGVDFVVFLNPDVRLAGPSLTELAKEMADRPAVGIATGPVRTPMGERVPSAWGPTSSLRAFWFAAGLDVAGIRKLVGRWLTGGSATSGASMAREEVNVDGHVLGGAMLVRARCFEEVGGFDEDFFMYWEDADLCERARRAGWKVALLPCAPFVHEAGTSSEGIDDEQRWRWYVAGARRFADKHLDPAKSRRVMAALRLGRMVRR